MFESDDPPTSEDTDRNELRISPTLNGRVAVRGDFDGVTGEMLLSTLSTLPMPTPAEDGTPDHPPAATPNAAAMAEPLPRSHAPPAPRNAEEPTGGKQSDRT